MDLNLWRMSIGAALGAAVGSLVNKTGWGSVIGALAFGVTFSPAEARTIATTPRVDTPPRPPLRASEVQL